MAPCSRRRRLRRRLERERASSFMTESVARDFEVAGNARIRPLDGLRHDGVENGCGHAATPPRAAPCVTRGVPARCADAQRELR
jgi:hypothetical protein